jgi:RimJ/RimL family protein N-acetyltransferase
LRPAGPNDAELIFGWRNDPFTISRGSSGRRVERAEHLQWFANALASASHLIFVALDNATPIGLVRFERKEKAVCVISIYLLEPYTGKGAGVEVIKQGCGRALSVWDIEGIVACVLDHNAPAQSAFKKVGFEIVADRRCPEGHLTLVLTRVQQQAK